MNHFNDKTVYNPVLQSCPLCESGDLDEHYTINRYQPPFKTGQCQSCGFIFQNPRFTDEVINNFYTEDYFKGSAEYAYHDERKIKHFARHVWDRRIQVLHRYVTGGSFLDVGASFGGLMEAAGRYYKPHGIEMSSYAGKEAAQLPGCTVHIGTLSDHPFEKDYFSAITMIEVIEHLADPAGAVEECFSLLKDRGVLVIQTANMAGRQARSEGKDYAYYMPGHISYFTMENLTALLTRTGFSRVKVFRPVEFGLLPKLKKSRGSFRSIADYRAWLRITGYHLKSKCAAGNFSLTSSMVVMLSNRD